MATNPGVAVEEVDLIEPHSEISNGSKKQPRRVRLLKVVAALVAVAAITAAIMIVFKPFYKPRTVAVPDKFMAAYRARASTPTDGSSDAAVAQDFSSWGKLAKRTDADGNWLLYGTATFELADGRAMSFTLSGQDLMYTVEVPAGSVEASLSPEDAADSGDEPEDPTAAGMTSYIAGHNGPVSQRCVDTTQSSTLGGAGNQLRDAMDAATAVDPATYPDSRVRDSCSSSAQAWATTYQGFTFVLCIDLQAGGATIIGPDFVIDIADIESASLPHDSTEWWKQAAPLAHPDESTDAPALSCNNVPDLTSTVTSRRLHRGRSRHHSGGQVCWCKRNKQWSQERCPARKWKCKSVENSDQPEDSGDESQSWRRLSALMTARATESRSLRSTAASRVLASTGASKHCVFVHGTGVKADAAVGSSFKGYWGDVHSWVKNDCKTISFLRRDTVNRAWTDDSNADAFCAMAATDGTVKDTVIFSHEMGSLIIAHAINSGKCSIDKDSSTWFEAQAADHKLAAVDFSQYLCSVYNPSTATDAAQRLVADTGVCTGSGSNYDLNTAMKSMGRAFKTQLQAAAATITANVKGAICGYARVGLSSSFYPVVLPTAYTRPAVATDDEVSWSKCWQPVDTSATDAGRSFTNAYYHAGYLNGDDTTCRGSNGIINWHDEASPCQWYQQRIRSASSTRE